MLDFNSFPLDLFRLVLLERSYDRTPVRSIHQIGGQPYTVATRIETQMGIYFAKWLSPDLPPLVGAELEGLVLLASADCGLLIPSVLGLAQGDEGMVLVLEWLETTPVTKQNATTLGTGLARLHRHISLEDYGLKHDNYVGSTLQFNDWNDDWPTFFGEQRLGMMARWLTLADKWSTKRAHLLDKLLKRLPELLAHDPAPSLLHGDLWHGNWLALPNGQAALIDPSTYFGDRETDLAMTRLFGGFPPAFYEAYEAEWPLDAGAAERVPIYNLFHLMNHLLLFGEEYGAEIDRILKRYA